MADKNKSTNAVVKQNKNQPIKKKDKPNIFKRMGAALKAMGSELKKVNWPDTKTVVKSTGVVLGVVFVFLFVVMGIDYGLSKLLELLVGG